jgi:hypothetical protein
MDVEIKTTKTKKKKKKFTLGELFLGVIGLMGILCALAAVSWIIVCGFIALLALCFGVEFNWGVATGIWIILIVVKGFMKSKGA